MLRNGAFPVPEGKYNYDFVLDEETVNRGENSHAKILQMVHPGSTVLECGPAAGVMTRYLKEMLHCRVFILEIDPESFAQASRFADGGICANLEDDIWLTELEGKTFDYILYADVLEHLRDPQAVLIKMKRFLKLDGSVILSVPNIANGDIIMNLLCDRFTYTPLGLLDSTHIHFFARQDLREMICASGFFLAEESCTRIPLFTTDQGSFLPREKRAELEEALAVHPTRNIYQFVCRLKLVKTKTISDIDEEDGQVDPTARFYLNCGRGYSEENRRDITPTSDQGILRYEISHLPSGLVSVRYDPIEAHKCILENLNIFLNDIPQPYAVLNGLQIGKGIIFCEEDPQIEAFVGAGDTLRIEVSIITLTDTSWWRVNQFLIKVKDWTKEVLDAKEGQLQAVNGAKKRAEIVLKETQDALAIKEEQLQAVNGAKEHAEIVLKETQDALAIKEEQLQTVNGAKKHAETALKELQDALNRIQIELLKCEQESNLLRESIQKIKNSFSWKVTKPLRAAKRIFSSREGREQ